MWVIKLLELGSGDYDMAEGQYVVRFAPMPAPQGTLFTTPDLQQCAKFRSAQDATTYYRQQHGLRPDGHPNRPMTAWTVEIAAFDVVTRQ
jgi:hypothetical protein